jgi:hypothetical protein
MEVSSPPKRKRKSSQLFGLRSPPSSLVSRRQRAVCCNLLPHPGRLAHATGRVVCTLVSCMISSVGRTRRPYIQQRTQFLFSRMYVRQVLPGMSGFMSVGASVVATKLTRQTSVNCVRTVQSFPSPTIILASQGQQKTPSISTTPPGLRTPNLGSSKRS